MIVLFLDKILDFVLLLLVADPELSDENHDCGDIDACALEAKNAQDFVVGYTIFESFTELSSSIRVRVRKRVRGEGTNTPANLNHH